MAKDFQIVTEFKGYVNKADITKIDQGYLVSPSQNVLINDGEKITIRNGYSLYGAASSALYPITSSHEWNTSTGTELPLRFANTTLEYYYSSAWRTLKTGFISSATLNFTEFWDATEVQDLLLFVDNTSNMYMWSGGVTTYASSTVNTITKQGAGLWSEARFLTTGTRQVIIGGITYTYTGGEGTTTLTGVTPDPTAGGHMAGDVVAQAVRVTANTPAVGVNNTIIGTLNNHVYVASTVNRDVYISKNTNYLDFTFSAPRLPGEGGLLTLDSPPVAFGVGEKDMYVSAGKNELYQTVFTLSADLTTESVVIQRLKTNPGGGALAQSSIGNAKNYLIYVSNEKIVDFIGRVESIDTPQSRPLSDPIKAEVEGYSVVIAPHVKYFKSRTYIAFPSESRVLIYDHERGFWHAPQVLPVRRFAVIGGELYGHSNGVTETYKLFTGTNDNTNPIDARAYFAYRSYDKRDHKKQFNEWFTEGYINSNTVLNLGIKYEFGGSLSIIEKTIPGTGNDNIIFSTTADGSFGKNPFGTMPLGSITDSPSNLSKFRIIHECTKNELDFYEVQSFYSTNEVDAQWELLAQGGNVNLATADNMSIKVGT